MELITVITPIGAYGPHAWKCITIESLSHEENGKGET